MKKKKKRKLKWTGLFTEDNQKIYIDENGILFSKGY